MASDGWCLAVTAGQAGHGKTSLVGALLGRRPDPRHEAATSRATGTGGFVHLELPRSNGLGSSPQGTCSLQLLDLPGQVEGGETFAAGVAGIDLALLVVAADEGWQAQTEEQCRILSYLGVTRAVIALAKCDLLPAASVPEAEARARQALAHTPFAQAPIVPTSIRTGAGLEALRGALAAEWARTPERRDVSKPRMPIRQGISLRDSGAQVSGILVGGTLRRGQEVVLQPSGRNARIRHIRNASSTLEAAQPGSAITLTLTGLTPRTNQAPPGIAPGEVVTLPGVGDATDTVDVFIERSEDPVAKGPEAEGLLADRSRVRLHVGTASANALVLLHGARELGPGQSLLAQLRLGSPVFVFADDRFVVRDESGRATLAGGRVLDPAGDRKRWQHKAQLALLQARAVASPARAHAAAWIQSALTRHRILPREKLLAASELSADEIQAGLAQLAADGRAIFTARLAAEATWWNALLAQASETIETAHRAHPERTGLPLNTLRSRLEPDLRLPGTFEAIVEALGTMGYAADGTVIRRQSHCPQLPPRLEASGAWVRQALAEQPLDPPSRKDLERDHAAAQALRFFIETGQAVEVGPHQVLLAEAYATAVEQIQAFLRQRGEATLSALRRHLGCTRRIAVPLCEKLDQLGITRRAGHTRTLAPPGVQSARIARSG